MLGGVVEGLLKAMRSVRPQTVRQFFALANQHMLWQLNDLARRSDERPAAVELREGLVPAPASSESSITPQELTQVEAAEVLDVSVKTVQRRLNRASLLLAEELDNLRPP